MKDVNSVKVIRKIRSLKNSRQVKTLVGRGVSIWGGLSMKGKAVAAVAVCVGVLFAMSVIRTTGNYAGAFFTGNVAMANDKTTITPSANTRIEIKKISDKEFLEWAKEANCNRDIMPSESGKYAGFVTKSSYMYGEYFINVAAEQGRVDIMEWLKEHGSEINVVGKGSDTICCAAKSNSIEPLLWLINNGVDIMRADKYGDKITHYAAEKNLPVILEWLKTEKVDLTEENKDGATPLMLTRRKARELTKSYHFLSQHYQDIGYFSTPGSTRHLDGNTAVKAQAHYPEKFYASVNSDFIPTHLALNRVVSNVRAAKSKTHLYIYFDTDPAKWPFTETPLDRGTGRDTGRVAPGQLVHAHCYDANGKYIVGMESYEYWAPLWAVKANDFGFFVNTDKRPVEAILPMALREKNQLIAINISYIDPRIPAAIEYVSVGFKVPGQKSDLLPKKGIGYGEANYKKRMK